MPANELHVWLADPVRSSPAQLAARYSGMLSADEQARYTAFRFDDDRQVYLAAHALLRITVARYTGHAPQDVTFARGANGKPAALLPAPHQNMMVNLTHTRGQVGCVLAHGRACGIDLEKWAKPKQPDDLSDIARLVFSTAELAKLDSLAGEARTGYFFTLWTLKEAYAKATGEGIIGDLTRVSFLLEPAPGEATPGRLQRAVTGQIGERDASDEWSFYSAMPGARLSLGVAVHAPAGSLRLCCDTLAL